MERPGPPYLAGVTSSGPPHRGPCVVLFRISLLPNLYAARRRDRAGCGPRPIGSASSGVTVLFALKMGQLRHALVQDTWLPEVGVGGRPHRVPV